jgi:hypothetical protein
MALITDIGVPGQPLNDPPLTEWQAAVRDALLGLQSGSEGTLTPSSGFAAYGGVYGAPRVTRNGPLVAVEAMLKPTADTAWTVGQNRQVGSLPAGFWPVAQVIVPAVCYTGAGTVVSGYAYVGTTGAIAFVAGAAFTTPAATGFISIMATFRGA